MTIIKLRVDDYVLCINANSIVSFYYIKTENKTRINYSTFTTMVKGNVASELAKAISSSTNGKIISIG